MPDIVVTRRRSVWVVDAKYKSHFAEIDESGWRHMADEIRDNHRADVHQVLSDAALFDAPEITATLAYPLRHETWEDLAARGLDRVAAGVYSGSRATAEHRLAQIREGMGDEALPAGRVMPVHLAITSPLRLDDQYTWGSIDVVEALRDKGIVTDEQAAALEKGGYLDAKLFRDLLEAKGYDGVVYDNKTEGGGDSSIALRAEQIRQARASPSAIGSARGGVKSGRDPDVVSYPRLPRLRGASRL